MRVVERYLPACGWGRPPDDPRRPGAHRLVSGRVSRRPARPA